MVATDVAGRGIDVEGVTHVVNYDAPSDISSFLLSLAAHWLSLM